MGSWLAGVLWLALSGGAAMVPVEGAAGMVAGGSLRAGTVSGQRPGDVPLEALREAVLADAAALWPDADRAGLKVQAEAVTWPDGSLGCAQPGQFYTQALVPGWRLRVSDGRRELLYHASRRGAWVQCPTTRAAPPAPGSTTR